MRVDGEGLARELNVPVLPLVASKGRGVKQLFLKSLENGRKSQTITCENESAEARHRRARQLAKRYVTQGERHLMWRDRLDDVFLHPVWGYVILLFVLYLFFQAVYGMGKFTEPPLLAFFDSITQGVLTPFGQGTLISEIVLGVMQGIAAGVAIVLPYLLPFLFGLPHGRQHQGAGVVALGDEVAAHRLSRFLEIGVRRILAGITLNKRQ